MGRMRVATGHGLRPSLGLRSPGCRDRGLPYGGEARWVSSAEGPRRPRGCIGQGMDGGVVAADAADELGAAIAKFDRAAVADKVATAQRQAEQIRAAFPLAEWPQLTLER